MLVCVIVDIVVVDATNSMEYLKKIKKKKNTAIGAVSNSYCSSIYFHFVVVIV